MSFRSRIQWLVDATVTGLPSYLLFQILGNLARTLQNFILHKSAMYLMNNDFLNTVEQIDWFLDQLTLHPLEMCFLKTLVLSS